MILSAQLSFARAHALLVCFARSFLGFGLVLGGWVVLAGEEGLEAGEHFFFSYFWVGDLSGCEVVERG